jgi:AcrR family transcriptional regulator
MGVFAAAGYKKAYVSEIAKAADISKALVFYYFGNKKALYFYLLDYARDLLVKEMREAVTEENSDFFDRIRAISYAKISAMERHPAIISFLNSVYYETDAEVAPELQARIADGGAERETLALKGVEAAKFKDGVDPKLVVNILVKFTEGVMNSRTEGSVTLGKIASELEQCLGLLKNNLYKEEYLK